MAWVNKKFYNSDGKKVKLQVYENPIEYGTCGYISKCINQFGEEKLLKEYYPSCEEESKLCNIILQIIHNIDNRHLVKLYEWFCYKKMSDYFLDIGIPIDAYTCDYIKRDSVNLLETSKEYLLENLYEIISLNDVLSNQKILLDDIKIENTIMTKEAIVLIDPDTWKIETILSYEEIRYCNIKKIMNLFQLLCMYNLIGVHIGIDSLFSITDSEITSGDITKIISDRLSSYKYPIEYLKKYTK